MVLVLGGTGLLGQNVVRVLLERGISVRALVRHSLNIPGVEEVFGSILSEKDLLDAAQGCDAIINCAGTTDMALNKLEDFLPVNRNLPRMLGSIATRAGVKVIVHTSTANTIAVGTRENPATEDTPFGVPYEESLYAISKKAGEDALLDYAAHHSDIRVVIVNPGFMLGAHDTKPSSGQLVLLGYKKPLLFVPRGAKSFLHVRDAAVAIVNALDRGQGRYLLTGQCLTLKQYYAIQAKVCGYRQLCITLPNCLTNLAGVLGLGLLKIGIHSELYPHNVRQLEYSEWYDCSRARRELDYPSTPVETAVKDFVEWYYSKKG